VPESYAVRRHFGQATTLNHKERHMSIKRHGVGPRLSQAVVHGNTVYLAGLVAGDPSADVKGQTEQILKKIDEHLAATGSHKSKLLSATIYLANMGLYTDMNAAWDAWVDPANTPARATVEARLATPRYLVEIMAIAAI
jgi:enamine deaminase RidA (YjgF/YER057c/UK114 family)